MRQDVMSAAGLNAFAEISIIIFVAVFVLIFARAILMRREEAEHMLNLPLDESPVEEEVPR